jgi:hypothetical protein
LVPVKPLLLCELVGSFKVKETGPPLSVIAELMITTLLGATTVILPPPLAVVRVPPETVRLPVEFSRPPDGPRSRVPPMVNVVFPPVKRAALMLTVPAAVLTAVPLADTFEAALSTIAVVAAV